MKHVVDTHVLLWFVFGSSQLSRKAKAVLDSAESKLIVPAIAYAESVWIVRKSKNSAMSVRSLLESINKDRRIEIYPLDRSVVERTVPLTAINEMHDRQIVATALVIQDSGEEVALLTCDSPRRGFANATLPPQASFPLFGNPSKTSDFD